MRPLTLSEIERNLERHTEELARELMERQGAAIAEREAEWEARRLRVDDRTPPDPIEDDRDFDIDYDAEPEDSWVWDLEGERF